MLHRRRGGTSPAAGPAPRRDAAARRGIEVVGAARRRHDVAASTLRHDGQEAKPPSLGGLPVAASRLGEGAARAPLFGTAAAAIAMREANHIGLIH